MSGKSRLNKSGDRPKKCLFQAAEGCFESQSHIQMSMILWFSFAFCCPFLTEEFARAVQIKDKIKCTKFFF